MRAGASAQTASRARRKAVQPPRESSGAGAGSKLVVFNAAIEAGMFPLAVIGIAASVIGAFYYLKVVKTMYFDEPADAVDASDDKVLSWSGGALALAVSPLGYLAIPALTAVTAQAAGALF